MEAEQDVNHAGIRRAIGLLVQTTPISIDEARTLAMNYPHEEFLTWLAIHHAQLSLNNEAIAYAYSLYANPTDTTI